MSVDLTVAKSWLCPLPYSFGQTDPHLSPHAERRILRHGLPRHCRVTAGRLDLRRQFRRASPKIAPRPRTETLLSELLWDGQETRNTCWQRIRGVRCHLRGRFAAQFWG